MRPSTFNNARRAVPRPAAGPLGDPGREWSPDRLLLPEQHRPGTGRPSGRSRRDAEAIVAIEDARYYQHGALDFRGTVRALIVNELHNPAQGGSTIAQQYVKNALILTATTPQQRAGRHQGHAERKIRELRIAIKVEHELTKNQLLAAYLNAAYFDNHAIGVQAGGGALLPHHRRRLTLPQAALLAGMVENPTYYNPLAFPGNALNRRNEVLRRWRSRATSRRPRRRPPARARSACTRHYHDAAERLHQPVRQERRVLLRLRARR